MLIVHKINALEPAVKPAELLLGEFITREANEAAEVKREKPILVVLGNPPYSGHSANRSYVDRKRKQPTCIGKLLEDYKQVDGQPLEEKNPKWLQDDYVKFIRFAEWRIEQTGQGVVAFITNHAYLDNPTFRGMRAQLLRTFQRLYIVNLHGNARRKERAPNGSPDENLFDIQQGVALLIAVRAPDKFPNADVIDTNADVIDTIDDVIDTNADVIDKIGDPDDNAPLLYYDVWGSREAKCLWGKVYFPRGACSTWRAGLRGSGFERVYGATRASRARTHNRARVEHVDRRRGEGLPRRGRPLQPHSGQGVPSESRLCARRQDSASDYGGRAARLFHPARAGLSRAAGCQRRAAAAGRVVP
jgi:hypothetical protein